MLDTSGIAFKVSGDSAAGEAALARMQRGFGAVASQADRTSTALLKFGKQGQLTAQQIQALSYQTTDIVTALASGQRPLLVLLQQGGQLRDQFGSVGNVLRGFAQVLTPARIALGGLAGVLGTVAYGFAAGYQESAEFRKQMALTGNAAGLTAGRVDALAKNIAEFSGGTIGNARDAVLELAKTGQFTGGALDAAGRAALAMQKLTGESIDDIVKRFAGARDGVARWAAEANRSYNFITAAQFQYIRGLEAQGRTQEALRVTFDSLAQVMQQRQAPALGALEKLWNGVKTAASAYWDVLKSLGRDTTIEDELAKVADRITQVQRRTLQPDLESSLQQASGLGFDARKKRDLDNLRQQQAYLQEQLRMQRAAAERAAAEARGEQKKIEESGKAHQDTLLAQERAGLDARLQQQVAGFELAQSTIARLYRQFELTPQQYRESTAAALRGPLDAEEAALRGQLDLARRRVVEKPADAIARDTAILQIQTKIAQVEAKRAELNREIAEFAKAAAPAREVVEGAQAAFRRSEIAAQAAVDKAARDRSLEAQRAIDDLAERNAALTADLIADERQRGQALIAVDVETQRRRLEVVGGSAEQIQRMADELATYQALRERQLTEQLKPEWQKRLDAYADTNRFMRESFDEAMNASLQSAEDTWADMIAKGELSFKRLVGVINEELARIGWRRFLAAPAAGLFGQLFGLLGVGGAGSFAANPFQAVGLHSGGIVGAGGTARTASPLLFAGARRYHSGGLAGDEIPAILQRGEEVLTRRDPRHALNGGGVVQNITYNVPPGYSPAAFAAVLEQNNKRLKGEMYNDLSRPGRPLYYATRR